MLPAVVTNAHPELRLYQLRTQRKIGDGEPHYLKLFLAVALGMTYQMQLAAQGV